MSYAHHDGQTALTVCGCGRLHLTYGPVTLNFQRDEFVKFARDVDRLAAYLTDKLVTARIGSHGTAGCH